MGEVTSTGSTVSYPTGFAGNVAGKVVLIRGAECQFSPAFRYGDDYIIRVNAMVTAGATGVIFAEGFVGKFPQRMADVLSRVPICVITRNSFNFLKDSVFAASPEAEFDLSQTAMLTGNEDDQIPNPWTSMRITQSSPPLDLTVPLMTSLFNPERTNVIEAPVVMAQWAEICSPQITDFSAQYFPKCIPCWAREGASFMNAGDMDGKIVFVPDETASLCYPQYFSEALLGQSAGALAVVYGRPNDDTGRIAGPVVIAAELHIPYFWVLNMHSTTIQELLDGAPPEGALRLQLPALQGRTGPPFFAAPTMELGTATIDIWMVSPTTGYGLTHIECDAGQAQYNPWTFHGTVLGDPNVPQGLQPKGVRARPSVICGSSLTCSRCLTSAHLNVNDQANDDADKAVVLAATFANAAQLAGAVAFFDELDFPCFHSDEQATRVTQLAGAKAVFLINRSSYPRTILAPASLNGTRYVIPTFDIGRDCWLRFNASVQEGASPVLVGLPTLVNGSTLLRTKLPNDQKLVAEISVVEPSSLRGIYLSGQASFNPDFYRSVTGLVEQLVVKDVCKMATMCSYCDKLDSPFEGPALALTDKIAVIKESDIVCLRPISNVVHLVEAAGGLGLIVLSTGVQVVSLVQDSIRERVGIPAFSIPALESYEGLGQGLLGDASVQLRLPSIVQGVAIPFSHRRDDGDSPGNNDSDGGGGSGPSKGAKAGIAIASVSATVITLILVFLYRRWYVRWKSYRQFEAGVQTQVEAGEGDGLLVRNEFNPLAHDMEAAIEVSRQPAVHEADLEMYKFKVDK
eukprot:jgi/Mesvir1/12293/Mv00497-RA.2